MTNKYEEFKTYLKKIGSGEFTGKSLTREETKLAQTDAKRRSKCSTNWWLYDCT